MAVGDDGQDTRGTSKLSAKGAHPDTIVCLFVIEVTAGSAALTPRDLLPWGREIQFKFGMLDLARYLSVQVGLKLKTLN